MAEMRYAYNYAMIDPIDNMCVEVLTRTQEIDTDAQPEYVPIPYYNEDYLLKYYNYDTQKWYTDAAMTNEWTPS